MGKINLHFVKAQIIGNEELPKPCEIHKGTTRQRWPLSPFLFILALEVLNRDIRWDERIAVFTIFLYFLLCLLLR